VPEQFTAPLRRHCVVRPQNFARPRNIISKARRAQRMAPDSDVFVIAESQIIANSGNPNIVHILDEAQGLEHVGFFQSNEKHYCHIYKLKRTQPRKIKDPPK